MDANYRIYSDDADKIPAEDKARLEGFLKGREETDLKAQMAELQQKIHRLKAEEE